MISLSLGHLLSMHCQKGGHAVAKHTDYINRTTMHVAIYIYLHRTNHLQWWLL